MLAHHGLLRLVVELHLLVVDLLYLGDKFLIILKVPLGSLGVSGEWVHVIDP